MLTPAFPSDLGLSDVAYGLLSNVIEKGTIADIDATSNNIISGLLELISSRLIYTEDAESENLSTLLTDLHLNEILKYKFKPTSSGLLLLNTLAQAGDYVVYLHKTIDADGQVNIHPIICHLVEAIFRNSSTAKIAFTSAEINNDGDIECVDISRATVSTNLIMRVSDYCSSNIRFHTDEARCRREHDLGLIEGHNP